MLKSRTLPKRTTKCTTNYDAHANKIISQDLFRNEKKVERVGIVIISDYSNKWGRREVFSNIID